MMGPQAKQCELKEGPSNDNNHTSNNTVQNLQQDLELQLLGTLFWNWVLLVKWLGPVFILVVDIKGTIMLVLQLHFTEKLPLLPEVL